MTSQRELESLLVDFFDDGPVRVSDRVIDDALASIDKSSVARPRAVPRRFPSMNILSRLATAAVFGLLFVGVVAYLSRPGLTPIGATATPGATAGASPVIAVVPNPTEPVASPTAPVTASPATPVPQTPPPANTSQPPTNGALIAYVRTTDRPKTAFVEPSFACRFVDGPTCPINRIWVVGVDGTNARELMPDGIEHQQLLGWSPDGNFLLYRELAQMYLVSAGGGEPLPVDTGCREPCWGDEHAAVSNDGTALVFVRGTSGDVEPISSVTTMDLVSGRVVELLSTSPKGGSHPSWSPDKQRIVFTRLGREAEGPFPEVNSAVFVVDADGQNLRQISPQTLDAEFAKWSPDGTRILFTSPNGDGADIYTMNVDGSDVRALATDGTVIGASWTPNGGILAARLVGGDDNALPLWTMDGDGANAAELIPGDVTGLARPSDPWFGPVAPIWQATGGPAIVPPPWQPLSATLVGPPPPTPGPTPAPEMAAGFRWTGSIQHMERYSGAETATKLTDGRVLVTKSCHPVAELYDPSTGTFSATGSMAVTRQFITATLLQDGRVLIAGGQACDETSAMLDSAEIYDPLTGTFSATGSMGETRQMHAAALLADGRVLVVGGLTDHDVAGDPTGTVLAATGANTLKSAEIYDPQTGTFGATGSMLDRRHKFTATTLLDGRVLVLGGGGEGYSARAAAEIYDPAGGTFDRTGSMDRARWLHTATLLADGRVLIAGGRTPNDTTLASVELYDPASGSFSTVGSMADTRQQHTATLLPDGRVLIAGGFTQDPETWNVLATTEIYDPGSQAFSSSGSMGHARETAVAVLLNDGRVLIAGGAGIGLEELEQLASAVLYEP